MNPEVKQAIDEYLHGLLHVLNEMAEIQYRQESEQEVHINLQGVQVFEGASFKALKALGYLTEIAVRRRLGIGIKIHLDVNDQKEKRLKELQQLAHQWAEEAVREGRRIELPPMETYDRKAIHEALSTFRGVRTYSRGRGSERHVIIDPTNLIPGKNPLPERPTEVGSNEDQSHK